MSNIVLQICKKFIGELVEFFDSGLPRKVEEMEKTLKEKSDSFLLEMIKAYLESLDDAIREDKAGRSKRGIIVERRPSMSICFLHMSMCLVKNGHKLPLSCFWQIKKYLIRQSRLKNRNLGLIYQAACLAFASVNVDSS